MKLYLDDVSVKAEMGQSLVNLIELSGLSGDNFAETPLAAHIAGEVFSLNYIPVRAKDDGVERPSIRAAMAASQGIVRLLRYSDPAGKEVYTRTAQFMLFLAIGQLWPEAKATMSCTVGPALFISIENEENFCVSRLKKQMQALVQDNAPLLRVRKTTQWAREYFGNKGEEDKFRLLAWRTAPHFDVYQYGDFCDYYYGELAPSTGYLQNWDILQVDGGFLFLFPDDSNPNQVADYRDMPHFVSVYAEGERWGRLMGCRTLADLNALTVNGKLRELIRVNEALHEKRYGQIADMICRRGCKAVMLAGPSSSGKTTSANRLATQLRVQGKRPLLMSLDDYYIDRDKCPVGEDGKVDLEHINTIDTELFSQHLHRLLDGETVEIPSFDFKQGKRVWSGHELKVESSTVIIVEGLHALNPALLPEKLKSDLVFRLYVSPLLPLNLDNHNRIPTSYLRLLRRCVRDYETRGSSIVQTLDMWQSVQRGEKRWIFPYQESADVIFNSSTLYELAILKKHIYPLLESVLPEEPCYEQVRAIVKILNYVVAADVEDEIPPTSLVREFIGGNTFYKK